MSFEALSDNKPYLLADIDRAAVTAERADMDAALSEAVRMLAGMKDRHKELYVISDFQRSNWAAVDFRVLPPDVKTVFLPVTADEARNLWVDDVTATPPFPIANEEVQLVCRVSNAGAGPAEAVLDVRLGERALGARAVQVAAGMTAIETFRTRVPEAGVYEGRAGLLRDRLAAGGVV